MLMTANVQKSALAVFYVLSFSDILLESVE